jgi:hypothetical protein
MKYIIIANKLAFPEALGYRPNHVPKCMEESCRGTDDQLLDSPSSV